MTGNSNEFLVLRDLPWTYVHKDGETLPECSSSLFFESSHSVNSLGLMHRKFPVSIFYLL